MKQFILAAAITLVCGAAAAAPAAPASNFYVGAGVGQSEQKYSIEGMNAKDNETAFLINGGYKFNQNVALEIGYTSFGKLEESVPNASLSIEPKSFYAAVVGTYPINEQFAVFGKLGAARTRTTLSVSLNGVSDSVKNNDNSVLVGIGASYAVTSNVDITLEYLNFGKVAKADGDSIKASQITLGARFSF
ncbi:MAG: outer membrane beta-barrel protein [Massilia sp.]